MTRSVNLLFSLAIFLAAALLFMVQPLAARMILPVLGGSPVVWVTAVAFFQVTLLAGYAFAHATSRLRPAVRAGVHAAVVGAALLTLPLALPAWEAPDGAPYLWLVGLLAVSVGAPFFVLASASPALAQWFTASGERDPYFLYAVSNAGSFVGLLSYPLVIEPVLGLSDQSLSWAWGFAGFAFLAAIAVGLVVRTAPSPEAPTAPAQPVGWLRRLTWVGLAFIPSSLLLGATTFITSEIGSVPLLWVVPLGAYLLTFVMAFRDGSDRIGSWPSRLTALLVFGVLTSWAVGSTLGLWLDVTLHVGLLFAAGLVAHLRLYRSRPDPSRLTEFYLLISLGGALGGIFNAFIAPLLFDWALEYPLVIVVATAVMAARGSADLRAARTWIPVGLTAVVAGVALAATTSATEPSQAMAGVLAVAAGAVLLINVKSPIVFAAGIGVLLTLFPPVDGRAEFRERTFFGILSVRSDGEQRSMYHGSTLHGTQFLDDRSAQAAAYYAEPGPLGDIFSVQPSGPSQIAVVGLGVGTLAGYGEPGDTITFFEIDSAVVELAEDPGLFTFLRDSAANVVVEVQDGRLGLEGSPDGAFSLIVLDAFSADSIPVHLLTVEALDGYLDKLGEGGMIAIHLSNRFFNLEPVIAAAAEEIGAVAIVRRDGGGEERFASRWVALAPDPAVLDGLRTLDGWTPLEWLPDFRVWTDDYSNPLAVLR